MQREESHFAADKERDSKMENAYAFYSDADRKRLKCDQCGEMDMSRQNALRLLDI